MSNSEESNIVSDEENITSLNNGSTFNEEDSFDSKKKKRLKTGVVYLSYIPPFMSSDILKRMLSKYAPVGRIFIQVVQEPGVKVRKKSKEDTMYEGWVEFQRKRHAKTIAAMLNNTKMGGKKKSRFYDCLWNIKYLPRFKWVHLVERLNYERAVMKQKLRAEISQAKRIANHFKDAVERQEITNRKKKQGQILMDTEISDINQKEPVTLLEKFKQKNSKDDDDNTGKTITEMKRETFLKSLFC